MQAKTKPLKAHEDVLVFGRFSVAAQYFEGTYNPEGVVSIGERLHKNQRDKDHITGNRKAGKSSSGKGYPKDVIEFSSDKGLHPTQKPVALMEYLIKTYTNEGQTVLDFTMGSGTTGVACKNLGCSFIGIELDEAYFNIAKERINGGKS
jgi:site-specific DNA-methyltransferase (adenine-specific)